MNFSFFKGIVSLNPPPPKIRCSYIIECPCNPGYNNYFGTLRNDDERCFMVTGQQFVNDEILPIYNLQRCHIMDCNLDPTVWSVNFQPNLYCPNPYPTTQPFTIDTHGNCNLPGNPSPPSWYNNSYTTPCPNANYY